MVFNYRIINNIIHMRDLWGLFKHLRKVLKVVVTVFFALPEPVYNFVLIYLKV